MTDSTKISLDEARQALKEALEKNNNNAIYFWMGFCLGADGLELSKSTVDASMLHGTGII